MTSASRRRDDGLAPRVVAAALVCALAIAACGDDDADGQASAGAAFDEQQAFADLEAQVAFGPRPAGSEANVEMTKFLARRLREEGVRRVRIQKPHRNVVGVIPGRRSGSVVVGAHHDTKDDVPPPFVGANDGASGVAVVLGVARALPDRVDGPEIRIALFDAEEARGNRPFEQDGTRGSRQYVRYARHARKGSPPLDAIRAMVLFDLVGDCDLQVPLESNSDRRLYDLFAAAAAELHGGDPAPFDGTAAPVSDDHVPFLGAGISAVDLIDFSYGPGPTPGAYWHTPEDTLDKVCPASLDAVGEAAVLAIPRIR